MELPAVTSALELYIGEINKFPVLDADEEFRLAVRFKQHDDMEAAEKLVVSNLRFVVKIAHEYRNYGAKFADLIQEGNIGLMHAVKKFDPYKGYRLISYAVWWIRAYMQNYIIKSWSMVKIGTTQAQRKLFFTLSQAKKKLETLSQKRPEFAEIAEALNVKEVEVEEMDLRMSGRDLSLDAYINEEGEETHLDSLIYQGEDQEKILIKKEEMELVHVGVRRRGLVHVQTDDVRASAPEDPQRAVGLHGVLRVGAPAAAHVHRHRGGREEGVDAGVEGDGSVDVGEASEAGLGVAGSGVLRKTPDARRFLVGDEGGGGLALGAGRERHGAVSSEV